MTGAGDQRRTPPLQRAHASKQNARKKGTTDLARARLRIDYKLNPSFFEVSKSVAGATLESRRPLSHRARASRRTCEKGGVLHDRRGRSEKDTSVAPRTRTNRETSKSRGSA